MLEERGYYQTAALKGELLSVHVLYSSHHQYETCADMMHDSLPTLATASVSLVCLRLRNQHLLDHSGCTVTQVCGPFISQQYHAVCV